MRFVHSDTLQGHHCYLGYILPIFTFNEGKYNPKTSKLKKKSTSKPGFNKMWGFFNLILLKIQVEDLPPAPSIKISPSIYGT